MFNFNSKIFTIFFLLITTFFVNLSFIDASFKKINNEKILYPSVTSKHIFEHSDIDDNFQWVRRSHENASIFKLSANINEDQKKNHFQSSRGLSYFLSSIGLKITNDSLHAITITKFVFVLSSLILFVLVGKFYLTKDIDILILIILTLIFSSRLFGGIINFYHFFEYFLNIKDFYSAKSIDRIPNILISNVIILINFIFIKRYYINQSYKNLFFVHIFLILSIFITPIIFIVFSGLLFFIYSYFFFNSRDLSTYVLSSSILFIIFSLSLIFHFTNLTNINDGSMHSPQWTGNYLYDLEIFLGPIIVIFLFFFKNYKKYFLEISFFLIQFVFYIPSFFYDTFLASKINENFVYLNCFLSLIIVFRLLNLNLKNINYKILLFFILIFYLYLFLQHGFYYKIWFTLLIIPIYSILRKLKNNLISKSIIYFLISSFFVYINIYQFIKFKESFSYKSNFENSQIELIDHINKNNFKNKSIITLDLGVLKNLSIHTSSNVYIANITNTNLSMQETKRRFFDIIYLYGFKSSDLKNYLFLLENKNLINSQYKLSEKEYLNYEKRSSFIFYKFIYHMLQIDSSKVTKNLIAQYQKYLDRGEFKKIYYFDTCLVTNYDENFIQKNSFFYKVLQQQPFFENSSLRLFKCELFK